MSFESLGLAPALVGALAEIGYATPTPIQSEAIPLALAGHDLLGGAQTGTGKTAAFVLPMLQRLSASAVPGAPRKIRALVLTPTRELAVQVHDSIRTYGKHAKLASTVIYGGAGMSPQIEAMRRGVDILVATPGRLIDHMERGTARLGEVELLVLDEADRMLDMGFLPAIKRILNRLPSKRQTMLFSATFEDSIKKLAMEFMREPREVQIAGRNAVAEMVTHIAHPVDAVRKRDLLVDILSQRWQEQILVFGKTKHGCNRLSEQLEKAGITAVAIHGNKSQSQRLKALAEFKSGKARVLVATDVAARGLDIPLLPLVINFDLPMVAEDYVHRIGRTGRAGASGEAISLVSPDEGNLLRAIHRVLKADIEMREIEGYAPSRPIRMGNDAPSRGRPGGQRPPTRRTPHTQAAPRHAQAHAGVKSHGAGKPGQPSRDRRAANTPRTPR
ncbi:MAG: DEAD/DEAH box helicase [Arenimonas sp.]